MALHVVLVVSTNTREGSLLVLGFTIGHLLLGAEGMVVGRKLMDLDTTSVEVCLTSMFAVDRGHGGEINLVMVEDKVG